MRVASENNRLFRFRWQFVPTNGCRKAPLFRPMNTRSLFTSLAVAASVAVLSVPACAQQADFNEVGKQMAIMLQNSHFARLPFEKLSNRFLDDFLQDLDGARMYFTQQDVDRFHKEYGDQLHALLLQGECMRPAHDIYRTFRERAEARVSLAKKFLAKGEFDFSGNGAVMRTRKEAPWPADEAAAAELWRQHITEAVLSENLRRETVARIAEKQHKKNPLDEERNPAAKIALRYERLLRTITDTDEEDIANFFLSAVARAYDPHTDYMSFREMDRFKSGMKNELVGIGALLQAEEDGATKIMGIVVNGPAERQGQLKLNDRVVGVDPDNSGKMTDILFMPIDKVVDLIRGKEDSQVRLKVEPAGSPAGVTKLIVIQRGKVELKDEQVSVQLVETKGDDGTLRRVAWMTIPSFYGDFDEGNTRVSVDVERLLQRLMEERMEGLVVDLRNNGGGLLEEVRRMTGFFINRGPVVQVKNTLGQIQIKDSSNRQPLYDGPLVIVTDRSSASASEIFAGALQDHNRAVIVGDSSTFGKGTVQQPMDIGRMLPLFASRDHAGFLKVTIQKYYRPSGSSTQLEGVVPDIILPNLIDALDVGEAHLDHALPHDRIRQAPDFNPYDRDNLFLPRLKELSEKRLKASKDFAYVVEDVMKTKTRIKENRVSLNKAERKKELLEADKQQDERNAERRARFAKIEDEDHQRMKFYKLTLDMLDKKVPLKSFDPTAADESFMRRAKDKTEDLDDSPKWPNGMDPVKREGLCVLRDLVSQTEIARMAGMLKKHDVR